MYPCWLLGAAVIWATVKAGYGNLVRVERPAIMNFVRFLCVVTLYRIALFKLFPHAHMIEEAGKNLSLIPWPLTLTVFWEDACHGLPLLLLRQFLGTKKWTWPIHGFLTLMVMLEFGLGHVYQGLLPAALLSLYVPYSIRLGKKYGFGTVMLGHTLWDLSTIISIKFILGT